MSFMIYNPAYPGYIPLIITYIIRADWSLMKLF